MIKGSIVALITPFSKTGDLDNRVLRELIRFHIARGTDGILISGTTGESPSLTPAERRALLDIAAEECGDKVCLIAGCGTNSTWKAVDLTDEARRAGATFGLSVCPYYNKPTQEGLYRHFMTVADCGLPLILYNVPGRTSVNMTAGTVRRLSRHENIVGIKEASGDLSQIQEISSTTSDDFIVLSGDDALTLDVISRGGKGVISVTANILPGTVSEIVREGLLGNLEKSRLLHDHIIPLHRGMFIETNPIPVKEALSLLGWQVGEPRLPLTTMSEVGRSHLRKLLVSYLAELEDEHAAFRGPLTLSVEA